MKVTEAAKTKIDDIINDRENKRPKSARLVTDMQGNLSLMIDNVKDNDKVFEHDGKSVLILTQHLDSMLGDKTLDYQEGQLILLNS